MSWHIDGNVLVSYESGAADRVTGAAVEAHLAACAECRGRLTVDEDWLERSWTGIADRVEPGRRHGIEVLLTSVGMKPDTARVVGLSPAFRLSFILGVVSVMGFAVGASTSDPEGWAFRVFLVLAPLLPVAGIGFAYGRLVDPVHELTISAPIDSFRILMLRSAAVLVVSAGLGLIAWPLLEAPSAFGFSAWLAPSLALTFVTLALASRFEVWRSAAMITGGWATAMTLALAGDLETFDGRAQSAYWVAALTAALIVVVRRHSYDREGGRR